MVCICGTNFNWALAPLPQLSALQPNNPVMVSTDLNWGRVIGQCRAVARPCAEALPLTCIHVIDLLSHVTFTSRYHDEAPA